MVTSDRPALSAVGVVALFVAVAVSLGGCAAITGRSQSAGDSGGVSSGGVPYGAIKSATQLAQRDSVAGGAARMPGGSASAGGATPVRLVIRTKTMTEQVADAKKAAGAVETLAKSLAGYVTDVSITSQEGGGPAPLPQAQGEGGAPVQGAAPQAGASSAGPFTATLTAKVPAASFEAFIAQVRKIGTVEAEAEQQQDVTQQHMDLTARIRNLKVEEARLRQFFAAAKNVRDMLQIEGELSRVRGEIEQLTSQLDYMNQNVAMATLTVTLHEPPRLISPAGPQGWGVGAAFRQAIRNFVDVINFLIMLTGGLLPFIILVVIAVLVIRWLVRRSRGKRAETAGAAAAATPARRGADTADQDRSAAGEDTVSGPMKDRRSPKKGDTD